MSRKDFTPDDIFINTIKAHPELNFFIYGTEVFYNNHDNLIGQNTNVLSDETTGSVSLFELNIDRSNNFISASSISGYDSKLVLADKKQYNTLLGKAHNGSLYAPPTSSAYPLTASITRMYSEAETITFGSSTSRDSLTLNRHVSALLVPAKKYSVQSKHFELSGTIVSADGNQLMSRNLLTSTVNIIDIPAILYGSEIKRGSTTLKYFITGSLLAECSDIGNNGVLVETTGSNEGAVVGLVFRHEGVIMLTASHDLESGVDISYDGGGSADAASWLYFGAGANDGIPHKMSGVRALPSASFNVNLQGTSYVSTMTLFCQAPKGKYNFSNNPTSVVSSSDGRITSFKSGSFTYSEPRLEIKNVVSSSYSGHEEDFERTTYISKIGIYDKNDNLIMIAAPSKPIRKKENDEYTFKLTYDI